MTDEEAIHEFDDAVVETAHNGRKVGDYDHVVISADVAAVLQKWIYDVRKHGFYPENDGQTHHATCWQTRGHHECAIKRVEELEDLGRRSLCIVVDSIMHGMPVTEEVADLRNQLVKLKGGDAE